MSQSTALFAAVTTLATAVLAAPGAASPPSESSAPAEFAKPRVEVVFIIEPIADLFMLVRSLAERLDADVPRELQRAVGLAREMHSELRHPLAWAPLTSLLDGCKDGEELIQRYAALPAEITLPGRAEPVELRERGIALAGALRDVEPRFLEAHWEKRRDDLKQAADELRTLLDGPARSWDRYVCAHFVMKNPQQSVNVLLSVDGPRPGAVTFRNRSGGGVCFVALSSSSGTQRLETVIHEVIHALDASTADEPTALNQMRHALGEAGVRVLDPFMRDLPHLLIFLQAAATVRSLIDPQHEDYGVSYGVYDYMGEPARLARARWMQYLQGDRDLPATIKKIVEEAMDARAQP